MPMVNPDGGERNRRTNHISWQDVQESFPQFASAPPAWYHRPSNLGINLPGFDLNRDFNADLDYVPRPQDLPGDPNDAGFYLSPESQAIRDVYIDLREEFGEVDVVVDLHHMGPCDRLTGREQDGRLISVSLDYPPLGVDDGAAYLDDWPLLDQDKSRRYALAIADGITEPYGSQSPIAAVGRYYHPDEREYAGHRRGRHPQRRRLLRLPRLWMGAVTPRPFEYAASRSALSRPAGRHSGESVLLTWPSTFRATAKVELAAGTPT
jgi:hypothetical protein